MNPILHPRLVNDPFEDPVLYVDFRWERRAVLFDIGNLNNLLPRKLLKISEVFVSHTHIDHFIGFDTLLRTILGRDRSIGIFGPPGIISNVEGKINAYTWNLIEDYPLSIEVGEVFNDIIKRAYFNASEGFKKKDREPIPFKGILIDEPLFDVKAVHLDHRTPSLAYSLKEKKHINIRKDALEDMGLSVGPWLKALKDHIRRESPEDIIIRAPLRDGGKGDFTLKELIRKVVSITPGQKITYVVDAIYSKSNIERIVELAKDSDILFCEAAFLNRDKERAFERGHLTARQAGLIGKRAGVKRLEVFHFSPRYKGFAEAILEEAINAFSA